MADRKCRMTLKCDDEEVTIEFNAEPCGTFEEYSVGSRLRECWKVLNLYPPDWNWFVHPYGDKQPAVDLAFMYHHFRAWLIDMEEEEFQGIELSDDFSDFAVVRLSKGARQYMRMKLKKEPEEE